MPQFDFYGNTANTNALLDQYGKTQEDFRRRHLDLDVKDAEQKASAF